ncbi:MAG: DUF58 domain-containing protein [Myxococcota bacterium]
MHRSRRRGSSVEFADHRAYVPGDDLRRIDWNAYARLEELVLRLHVAEDELRLYVLIDASASMAFGDPTKLELAQRLAAGLSYVALHGGDRVAVHVLGVEGSERARGRQGVPRVLRAIERMTAGGPTALMESVERFLRQKARPGLVVLLSDWMDFQGQGEYASGDARAVAPGLQAVDRLLGARFEVATFHLLARSELEPDLEGTQRVVDVESGEAVDVHVDDALLREYDTRLRAFLGAAESHCARRGVSYVRLASDAPVERALIAFLRGESTRALSP